MKKIILFTLFLLTTMSINNLLLGQTYIPTVDTYIDQNSPGISYGTSSNPGLLLRTTSTATRISFFEFDIAGFIGTVVKAELNLYFLSNNNFYGTDIVDAYEVTGTISNDLTWNNHLQNLTIASQPTASISITTSSAEPNYGYYKWDITSIAQANAGTTNKVKLALKMRGSTLYGRFYSQEGTGVNKPKLEITSTSTSVSSQVDKRVSIITDNNTLRLSNFKNITGTIFDIKGAILKNVNDVQSIDISSLSKGVYVLRLQDNTVLKFIKS